MKIHKFNSKGFEAAFKRSMSRIDLSTREEIRETVRGIVRQVRRQGDRALVRYAKKFDGHKLNPARMKITPKRMESAFRAVEPHVAATLKAAARRIKDFHLRQKETSWSYKDRHGNILGWIVKPIESVGLYIPGGKAAYPSTVLMNAIPARVAGVDKIVAVSPAPAGTVNPLILAAAHLAGVDEIYTIGGAQAVAALAFGTRTVHRVDKIVGPGNIFVAEAKRAVFGEVGIDSIAGPSEILIVADRTARPDFIAADLLSQAEHDEMAVCVLVTDSEPLAMAVKKEIKLQLNKLSRGKTVAGSLKNHGKIFLVRDMAMATEFANRFAPEHLELAVRSPEKLLKKIRNAGAVFLGHYTPEALGDYVAGPNHVLPTGGTARFFSPLGVRDFMKRSSLISFTPKGLKEVGPIAVSMAGMEGLDAHGRAVEIRLEEKLITKTPKNHT